MYPAAGSRFRIAVPQHLLQATPCDPDAGLPGYSLTYASFVVGLQACAPSPVGSPPVKGTWTVTKNLRLPREQRLPDGSFLSRIYPSERDRRKKTNGVVVRVIEYTLEGVADAEPLYRLITTLLDPDQAPAHELAALYRERWEIENTLDEFKTHLRGARIILRSKTPELVRQEFYGFLLAHFAIRGLMHEAALKADEDPDRLSFVHSIRVIRRKLPQAVALPPSGPQRVP